jgi:hypothetical protein
MNWIDVKDELPKDFQEVLFLAINEMGTKEIMTGHIEEGAKAIWNHCCLFYSSRRLQNVTVTHWMRLPDYPDSEN